MIDKRNLPKPNESVSENKPVEHEITIVMKGWAFGVMVFIFIIGVIVGVLL